MSTNLGQLAREIDRIFSSVIDVEEGAFGQWLSGLWTWHPELPFEDQKEAFFILLERLLREGKAVLIVPVDIDLRDTKHRVQEGFAIWDRPIDEQVLHVRKTFPADAAGANDMKITDYFYSNACPQIGWIDSGTGKIVAS